MMSIKAKSLDDLWDKVNNTFIHDPSVVDFTRPGVSIHSFHNVLSSENANYSITLNDLGYKITKWSMLMRLYFDPYEYKMMIARLRHYKENERRGRVYVPDIGMQFRSRENRTGACLMGITFRYSQYTGWQCSVFSRTNETTARWSVDLLFLHRLIDTVGKELGYFTVDDVKVFWSAGSLFQSVTTAPLYMVIMNREKELIKMAKKARKNPEALTPWELFIAKRYGQSYNAKYSPDGSGKLKYQTYKSQVRVTNAYLRLVHQLPPDKTIPNESLLIPKVDLTIDDDFFTRKGFR